MAQTPEEVLKSTQALLERVKTEGITDISGKQIPFNQTLDIGTLQGSSAPITMPEPKLTDYSGLLEGGNVQLKALAPAVQDMPDYMKTYLKSLEAEKPQSQIDLYGKITSETGLEGLTTQRIESINKLNVLQAELEGITAQAKQAQLQLEQQAAGKDVTTTFLGRQQQEITRQAAIKALPLQAEILAQQAIVQNNTNLLTAAQDKVNTLFQLYSQDQENERAYNKSIREAFYEFATKAEQRQLDLMDRDEQREYNERRDLLNTAKSLAFTALENGQSDLFRKLMDVNITSEEVSQIGAEIKEREEMITTPTVKSGGLIIAESDIAKAQQKLDASRDFYGYVNTPIYLQMLEAWKKDEGLEQDFFTQFPPKNYLNPNDRNIPQYLREKLSKPTEEETDTEELTKAVQELNKPWWKFW